MRFTEAQHRLLGMLQGADEPSSSGSSAAALPSLEDFSAAFDPAAKSSGFDTLGVVLNVCGYVDALKPDDELVQSGVCTARVPYTWEGAMLVD